MLLIRGTLVRTVTEIPLCDIESLEFRRTIPGRLLGYGSLAARSGGGRRSCPAFATCRIPNSCTWRSAACVTPMRLAGREDDDL